MGCKPHVDVGLLCLVLFDHFLCGGFQFGETILQLDQIELHSFKRLLVLNARHKHTQKKSSSYRWAAFIIRTHECNVNMSKKKPD